MPKLMVSYDAGIHYEEFMKSDSTEELVKRASEKRDNPMDDISWCRWYIENEDGTMNRDALCPVHKELFALLSRLHELDMQEEVKR